MNNTNFVCFKCRITKRYPNYRAMHTCHACGDTLNFSFHKFYIPKKLDVKGWSILKDRVSGYNEIESIRVIAECKSKISALKEKLKRINVKNGLFISKIQFQIDQIELLITQRAKF